MNITRNILALAIYTVAAAFSVSAHAATVGVAVEGVSNTPVLVGNTLVSRPLLGGRDAIEYFIPLNGVSGVYGAGGVDNNSGFGQVSDSGNGGGVLSMFLMFTPVSTSTPSQLDIYFEDLDLIGVNDPNGFLETINVLDANGSTLVGGPITNIGNLLVTGIDDTQTLSMALGVLATDPFFLQLDFTAGFTNYRRHGTNTAEYLIAEVTPVPLPAALPLFAGGLGLMGLLGWRRKRRTAA